MNEMSGAVCPGCGRTERASILDTYKVGPQPVALKLRCHDCGGVFVEDL